MHRTRIRFAVGAVLAVAVGVTAQAGTKGQPRDPDAVQRLTAETGGAEMSLNEATGTVRFARRGPGRPLAAGTGATVDGKKASAAAFLDRHGRAFGLSTGSAELTLRRAETDRLGHTHFTYTQEHAGVPVFGAVLKAHFDRDGNLTVVNGTLVPDIDVPTAPSRSAEEAGATALRSVKTGREATDLSVRSSSLLIFREGLAKGVPGDNHLAYEVEVGNGTNVREFVYVDAHSGKFIDQITGTPDGLYRRAYDGLSLPTVPPSYPANPYWKEGDSLPTPIAEANNMIYASKDAYDLFWNAFGRDSFDGSGAIMDAIFNRGYNCPNASWNGTFISFCPGMTSDDVTGHEWTHAYTEYTDGLIYQWQPGALSEAASDIYGETIDRINGRGTDTPNNARAGACTVFTVPPPSVTINAPAAIAGVKRTGYANFAPFSYNLTNDVVLANDGYATGTGATTSDGCCAATASPATSFVCAPNSWPNAGAIAGKIAIIDRGTCGFSIKVKNAQDNGAVGVIIANNQGGNSIVNMAPTAGFNPTIPAASVTQNDGTAIKTQLAVPTTVNATLLRLPGTDNSVRWLMGEDDTAVGLTGALRDMWNPPCYGNPGKVSDTQYSCTTDDGGGVHNNSGVDNHAYALMVDGGTYNNQTITGIGLTKAAHIYFRAKLAYQGPATDFAEHADALEQACADLTGTNLAGLTSGAPSEVITPGDCTQVAKAILAVEMRTPPTQCNFQPLLAKNPPPLCAAGGFATPLFHDNFDNGNSSTARWSVSHVAVTPADFTPRDWQVVSGLPNDRPGQAFFGPDPSIGTCAPGGDESGVLYLVSPQIAVPASVSTPMLTFDHWVATEAGYDGGNLKISVNDGPWQPVQATDFVYNPYNTTLFTAAQGNTNPLAGQPAFSGTDGGDVDGSWGRSIVNLAPYAKPKDKIRLRFDLGTDGCGGYFGWYIDDLMVYKCH